MIKVEDLKLNVIYKCNGSSMDRDYNYTSSYIMKLDEDSYHIIYHNKRKHYDEKHVFLNFKLYNMGERLENSSLWRTFSNFKLFKTNNANVLKLIFSDRLAIHE